MIKYQLFPRSVAMTKEICDIIDCFEKESDNIDSEKYGLSSNEVLSFLCPHLKKSGFSVETGKAASQKIDVPVLFGLNNKIDKSFNADALSADGKIVIEVEAGRGLDNNQFLKDIFEASLMYSVEFLVIALRHRYRGRANFEFVRTSLETLYISNRIKLPLKGILLIGY